MKIHLKLIFRNLKRDKTSFLINLIGLSTGMACALLILLWIRDEINTDRFHKNDKNLYQVMQNFKLANGVVTWDYTPSLMRKALIEEIPGIKNAVTVNSRFSQPSGILSFEDTQTEAKGIYSSEGFFQVFSFDLVQGDAENVLANKNAIVLTESLALKLFNKTTDCIGKTVKANSNLFNETFYVSGIVKNPPKNSTIKFDFLINFDILASNQDWVNRWQSDPAETYLVLNDDTDVGQFNQNIAGFLRTKSPTREPSTLFLQQFSKRYLHKNYIEGKQSGGRIIYVKLFSIVAIFIMLLACINFMNLYTAQSDGKLKQVGIKKVTGAKRKTLITQFLGESVAMTVISFVIALLIVLLILPVFNQLTGKQLTIGLTLKNFFLFAGFILLTGLISGSYPAFYLSGYNSVRIFKGSVRNLHHEVWVRKGLVVFQFVLSVIFIVAFITINKQIKLIQTKNLDYNRDNVLCFRWKGSYNDLQTFMAEVKNIPGVLNASNMNGNIVSEVYIESGYSWRGIQEDKDYAFKNIQVGYDFLKTLNIEMVEGRSFSMEFGNEQNKVLINQTAKEMMGTTDILNKNIEYGNEGDSRQVIGVVKNFHYGSFYESVEPLVITFAPWGRNVLVKILAGSEKTVIGSLQQLFKKFNPVYPFEYDFLDSEYKAYYESENRIALLSKYFTTIAIIISCLGLFGMATFTAQRRTKEIGIRKVNGSSEFRIIKLLTSDYGMMVFVAIVIALPLSFIIARSWLQKFVYKIELSWWIFALAGLLALAIALLTVSVQSWKAATRNPVEALRYE